ncbi:UNVERIFIED_CONTAM: ABC-type nitrate/sulfonate/bicarbonate transport system substrate-binding protein [Williamsia faeni]
MTNRPHVATSAVVAVLAALTMLLASCSSGADAEVGQDGKVSVRYQGSASQVQWQELAESLGYFKKVKLEWVGDTTSGPQDIQAVATGAVDTGGAFNGSVAKLQQAGSKVTGVISVNGSDDQTFQGYYSLEGSGIETAQDLVGKTVGINTLGAYHEYAIKQWLHDQGLSDDDIKKVVLTVVPPINTEVALRQGQLQVGNLGTIFKDVALEKGGLHEIFRDTDLIGNLSIATQVFRDDYIKENPEVVKDYVQGVSRAIRWAQVHPREEVVNKFVEIIDARGRNENTNFVKKWKSPGIPVPGGVIKPEEFTVWVDEAVRLGELPAGIKVEDLYTNEFNPYANGTYPPDSNEDGV